MKDLYNLASDIECTAAWLEEGIKALGAVLQDLASEYNTRVEGMGERITAVVIYRQLPTYLARLGVIFRDLDRQMEDINQSVAEFYELDNQLRAAGAG